jgi:2-methylisocitrate lyase-like PEP mutase family enzyme
MTIPQREKALHFRSLHDNRHPLALPNVWDVASARIVENAGAAAVATTSAGVAWSLGAADGEQLNRDLAIDLVARIAAAVQVPVTVDIEGGYASTADGVGETIRLVLEAGAVGVNLEDMQHGGTAALRPVEEQRDRVAAARAAADAMGIPMFLNARIDTYLLGVGDPADRLAATVSRAAAYLAAGADGIFVPGVVDSETVSALTDGIRAPLNIMAGPGAPTVDELAKLGVTRISVGAAIAQAAYALVQHSAREMLTSGGYTLLGETMAYNDLNALFSSRPGD